MRFPSRLLAANLYVALWLWGALVTIVALIVVGVAIFGEVTSSAWEKGSLAPRWYALFVGVGLITTFLPMYVAHGQTRRRFAVHAGITVSLMAPAVAAMITLGYLAERGIYHLVGWEQVLDRSHLFSEPTQLHLVFLEHLLELLTWMAAGTFISAGFYRWRAGGLLTIPVGVALVVLTQGVLGTELDLPIVDRVVSPDAPQPLGLVIGAGLLAFLIGLALTWTVVRDVPLPNKVS
ncbi:hypothetical protein [Plantactinospora soyae]|uniref:Uncharacterized protein n=1 Tax=Plantactinospora soyae TaxID=1544732 RepID=A0A927M631_9ACTN|nr:hypothetical protein [Plantactinospora soyae]MBE1487296.1 hypothetical protein [Plantactinospora soyae]